MKFKTWIDDPIDAKIFKLGTAVFENKDGKEFRATDLDAPDWVCVIAERKSDRRIALVQQFRFGVNGFSTEFPGGTVEPDEAPVDAALRELREETGLTPEKIVCVGAVNPNPAFMGNTMHIYLATGCRQETADPDDDEQISLTWVHEEDIDKTMGVTINHSLMVAAWYLYKRFLLA